MTNPGRLRDLADVMEVIKVRDLRESFADELDPYVRPKYRELWAVCRASPEPLDSEREFDEPAD
jgi:hypothetical protein